MISNATNNNSSIISRVRTNAYRFSPFINGVNDLENTHDNVPMLQCKNIYVPTISWSYIRRITTIYIITAITTQNNANIK